MKHTKHNVGMSHRIMAFVLTICMVATSFSQIVLAQAAESASKPILLCGFAALPNEIKAQSIPLGVSPEKLNLPDRLKATARPALKDTDPVLPEEPKKQPAPLSIQNVTWRSDPVYSDTAPGVYTFTAVLPQGYALQEGAVLPKILVTVMKEALEKTAYEKVVELFVALPGANSITAETTSEEKEAIRARLDKAMAAYDALTEAERTLFDEEHNVLLIAALALNDALTGNAMNMLVASPALLGASPVTLYVNSATKDNTAVRADGAQYKTLSGAVDKATSGDTIILNTDSKEFSVFIDIELTIDFNGHVLTLSSTTYGIDVSGTAKLTLKDSSGSNSGGVKESSTQVECILLEDSATVTIESGSYVSNLGYCVEVADRSTGQVIINGGSFTSSSACVYNDGSTARIFLNGGTFSGNISGANSGVLLTPEVFDRVYGKNNLYNNIYIHFPSGSHKLTKDLDLHDWQLRILEGEDTTIDLNGFNITGNGMKNAPLEGGGVIISDSDSLACLIQVHDTGTLTVGNSGQCDDTHGRIYNVNNDIWFTFRNYGNLILNGNLKVETLVGSEAGQHGQNCCVYLNSPETTGGPWATLTVNDGVELHAEAVKDGTNAFAIMPSVGDIFGNDAYKGAVKVTINGGKLYGEKSTLQMSGTLEVNGGTFTLSPATKTECLYIGWPEAQIDKIENAHFEGNSTGLWIGGQVSQVNDITLKNTTMNASSASPLDTALVHESANRVIVSGKNTLWIADAIRGTQPGGILDIRAGVYSTDPSQYVLDANGDGIKDYAVLDYANATVSKYFLVAPWTKVGTDNKISLYYPTGAAATDTASDDVSIEALKDTESIIPDITRVQGRHFTLSSDANAFAAIGGLSVTALTNGNRLTVQKTKACNATEAYVWYGGKSVGKIIIATKSDPTYDVGGEITGAIGKPTAYLIRNGVKYNATVTGNNNPYGYVVAGVPAGIYDLVVSSATAQSTPANIITTTVLVEIINHSIAQNVVLPQSVYNSVVTTVGTSTPNVEAGGLDTMAKTVGTSSVANNYVLIELKVAENESSDHAGDVRAAITGDGMIKGIIMDTDVLKTVNNAAPVEITQIDPKNHGVSLITAVFHLPANLQGKDGYAIFRYHGAQVNKITEIANLNGEYMEVNPKKDTITAHLNRFSTYSIAYTEKPTVTFDANGGSVTPTSAITNAQNKLDTLPTPTKSGNYSFDGWYTSASGGSLIAKDTVFTSNSTIYARWTYQGAPDVYYTITPKSGAGGQVTPGNRISVRSGESAGFSITADKGYQIADVKVDGRSVGVTSQYIFTNIWSDRTIEVIFKKTAHPQPPAATSEQPPDNTPGNKSDAPDDNFDKQKEDIKDDINHKRDEAITALPDSLTNEQRQKAIDELNKACDDALNAIDSAKTAGKVSDILNDALQVYRNTIEKFSGEIPVSKPDTQKSHPFILLSALLALAAVLLAVLAVLKKCTKKRKLLAILGAVAAVLIFLVTTGWSGIAFANLWTLAVALAAVLPAFVFIAQRKEDEETGEDAPQ